MSEYTREEFELDRAGQTGEDLREKFKSSTPNPGDSDRIERAREWLPKQDWYPFKECRNKDDWMAGAFADFATEAVKAEREKIADELWLLACKLPRRKTQPLYNLIARLRGERE